MVAAAAVGYGIYEDAELQKDIHWVNYHLGRGDTKENVAEVRKIIEDAMVSTGMPMRDVAKAATEEARLMKGTPGESSGIAALPDFLRAAASEAMAKDTTVQESMKAIIGLAHMVKAYTPEAIHKLLPAFAYLSTANPAGLKEMEKSFSYAVPILQSGADVDPITTMLLGTALSTAGVTSSKSGTWLREFAVRAMPGDAKHNKMLNRFGLLDDNDKPTWFTNGRPDPTKALEIAGPIAAQMPPEERLPAEMDLFGRRGGGAFAVLGDAKVLGRIAALRKEMESEGFKNRYATILEDYKGTAVGTARTTLAEFNVTMMRLGDTVLPAVTGALRDFSSVLQGIRALIPGQGAAKIGTRGIEFATAGGILGGIFGGPIGLIGGAMFGGAVGLTEGSMENDAKGKWTSPGKTGHPAKQMNFLQGPPIELKPRPISLSLNVDGRTLAQSISDQLEYLYEHATGAPSYDGQRRYNTADGQMTGA